MIVREATSVAGLPPGDPATERSRIEALLDLGILDTPPEQAFDDLAALAARLCAAPMAVVSLIDADRAWFKARVGVADEQVDRGTSLCHHVVQQTGILMVPDTLRDNRFAENPLVTDAPGIRCYAGAPLVTSDGHVMGALCVMDTVPRVLGEAALADLALVARQVVSQLELRRQTAVLTSEIAAKALVESELRQNRYLLDEVLAHTDVLVFAKDLEGRYLFANAAVDRAVGQGTGAIIGRVEAEISSPRRARRPQPADSEAVEIDSLTTFTEEWIFPGGNVRTYQSTKFPLVDEHGLTYAIAGVSTDVTELTAVRAELQESARRFRSLFERSPVGIGLSDESGRWIQVNDAFGRLMGVEPDALVGRSALDFAHPDDFDLISGSESGQMTSPDHVMRAEMRFFWPDGSIRYAWVNITPAVGPNGEPWTLAISQDITDRKEAENALRRSEEELAAIAAVARCVQSGTDPRPVVVASVRSLSGAQEVRLLEPGGQGLLAVTAADGLTDDAVPPAGSTPDLVRHTGRPVMVPSTQDAPVSVLWEPVLVEGEVIAVLQVTWPHPVSTTQDPSVDAVRVLAVEAGASLHAAQLRSELEKSATTDPLTGALNRRAWETSLLRLMERSKQESVPLTIALIDLDNFKAYNDSFGHAAGDQLLCQFAVDVRAALDEDDLFARWGGEEFILALAGDDGQRIGGVLQHIRAVVPGTQTCSIGYAVWQPDEPAAACVGRADVALYAAKREGRDRVVAA
ncbi:diguanylate cyclase (GGDEF)-like protein/PAS domain S-box-containing protein [Nakamurella sp. UYEF19]|uniref:diguanylate cyclase domain-containing protein n=1 Tax=Nakamurella sp. UYEF19 TaxID=1756392 RepID=UPI00339471C9